MGFENRIAVVWALGLALGGTASADEWDVGNDTDNASTTDNALAHGTDQWHDLAALPGPVPDQDWYLVTEAPFSSYEFLVDGMTGDLDLLSNSVERIGANGTAVALVEGSGGILALRWKNPFAASSALSVRVKGAACGNSCTGDDRYHARFYDTTYTIPRFNNSGTQQTVLLVQNATNRSCLGNILYMNEDGTLAAEQNLGALSPHRLRIHQTALAMPGASGSIRIIHDCGYGGLSGKAVALEPSTGFTFETPMVARPN